MNTKQFGRKMVTLSLYESGDVILTATIPLHKEDKETVSNLVSKILRGR